MVISNDGKIVLGKNVTFVNSTRFNLAGINRPCSIHAGRGAEITVGERTGFSGCAISSVKSILIGSDCNFGVNTCIYDHDFHPLNYLDRRADDETKILSKPVQIGNDVFVGGNSMILKGSEIGDRAIIGAGSVVSGKVPCDEIWAGNPLRFIKMAP